MKILHKTFPINTSYPLERLGNPDQLLFFDIETTGLSPYTSSLYLIGCVTVVEGMFQLTQFFIESMEEESNILKEFSALVEDKELLIQYNGDTFDVPYLNHCYEQYHLPSPFEGKRQLDLLKKVRSLKKLLSLPNCKLKTAESFLGIRREDPFSGGELIEQYKEYIQTKDPVLFRNLILHNEEDLEFLPPILDFLWYDDLSSCACTLKNTAEQEEHLALTYELSISLPSSFTFTADFCNVTIEGSQMQLCLPLLRGQLCHFYEDYKNYYYLPEEDMVVHKKIADFMPAGHRVKATRQNCCVKRCGTFVPQIKETITPSFKEDYRSRNLYFELCDTVTEDDWCHLAEELLQSLIR